MLAQCDTDCGQYMACCLIYRGNVLQSEANEAIAEIKSKKTISFVDWCPTGFKFGINRQPLGHVKDGDMYSHHRGVSMIANSTAIQQVFKRITDKFDGMFSRKAYIHWYVKTGMEEGELYQARQNLEMLEEDYKQSETAQVSQVPKSRRKKEENRLSMAVAEKQGLSGLTRISTKIENLMSNLKVDADKVRASTRMSNRMSSQFQM